MPAIRNLLCAADDSYSSRAALEYAMAFASGGGRVEVIHVEHDRGGAMGRFVGMAGGQLGAAAAAAPVIDQASTIRAWLDEPWATSSSLQVLQGAEPAETIVREAVRRNADAIVVGTHGRTGLRRLLGSVAAKVLRTSHVPTLVVPSSRTTDDENVASIRTVLCAIELDDHAPDVVREALQIADDRGAALHVVHCWQLAALSNRGSPFALDYERDLHAQLVLLVARVARGREVLSTLRYGPATTAIEIAARDTNADLVVMGTHGRTGLAHAVLGSVAEHVVRTSSVPVLAVPPSPRD